MVAQVLLLSLLYYIIIINDACPGIIIIIIISYNYYQRWMPRERNPPQQRRQTRSQGSKLATPSVRLAWHCLWLEKTIWTISNQAASQQLLHLNNLQRVSSISSAGPSWSRFSFSWWTGQLNLAQLDPKLVKASAQSSSGDYLSILSRTEMEKERHNGKSNCQWNIWQRYIWWCGKIEKLY